MLAVSMRLVPTSMARRETPIESPSPQSPNILGPKQDG